MVHTLNWMKQELFFPSTVIDRRNYNKWKNEGESDIISRARDRANEIIANYQPKPIPKELKRELESIMLAAGKPHGMDRLPPLE
jgi:trimethylamine:corrinoid methyltransferase-like protein